MDPNTLETVKKLQQKVAEIDSSIMSLDPNNEDDAKTILLAGAILLTAKGGGSISFTAEEEDGRTETVAIQSMGVDTNGEPLMMTQVASSDGKLAPETADMAAKLIGESHQAEVDRLIGE